MICAIHQPNFFPWLGYFDKIYRSDIFVFLDAVDYPKSSKSMSSWTNRVAVLIQEKKQWINCPAVREDGRQRVCDVKVNNSFDWRSKLIRTLNYNYSRSGYYAEIMPYVEKWIYQDTELIADFNIAIIKEISEMLDLNGKFIRQSDIATRRHATELLIEITKKAGCSTYLCGRGSSGYQKDELFEENSINLLYQNFKQPIYRQGETEFVQGLSILDALFHNGFDQTRKLIVDS